MCAGGGFLFAAYRTHAYPDVYFRIEVTALVLAGIHADAYHLRTEREIAEGDDWVHAVGLT
jgi:hypothetical protein